MIAQPQLPNRPYRWLSTQNRPSPSNARIENWLYWIAIDGVLVFLFYVQDLPFLAFLNVLFIGIAAGGFIAWRRRLQAQMVPA